MLQDEGIDCNMTLLFSFAQVGWGGQHQCAPVSLPARVPGLPACRACGPAPRMLGCRGCEGRAALPSKRRSPRCPRRRSLARRQAQACADAGAALISPFVGRIMDWHKKKEGREFVPEEVRHNNQECGAKCCLAAAGCRGQLARGGAAACAAAADAGVLRCAGSGRAQREAHLPVLQGTVGVLWVWWGDGVCGACVHGRSGRMGRLLAWRASAPAAPPRSTTAHPPLPPCRQAYNYPTTVMAASFRNVGEIRQLAG